MKWFPQPLRGAELLVLLTLACGPDRVAAEAGTGDDTGSSDTGAGESSDTGDADNFGWEQTSVATEPLDCADDLSPATLMWVLTFEDGTDVNQIVEHEGGLAVVASRSSGAEAVVFRLAADATISWARSWTMSGDPGWLFVDAHESGSIVVAAADDEPVLAVLDATGVPLWSLPIMPPAVTANFQGMVVTDDEIALSFGYAWERRALADGELLASAMVEGTRRLRPLLDDGTGGLWAVASQVSALGELIRQGFHHYDAEDVLTSAMDYDPNGEPGGLYALDTDTAGNLAYIFTLDFQTYQFERRASDGALVDQLPLPAGFRSIRGLSFGPADDRVLAFAEHVLAEDADSVTQWSWALDCVPSGSVRQVELDGAGQTWILGEVDAHGFIALVAP